MIVDYLKNILPEYEIKKITEDMYKVLYDLYKTNTEYFSYFGEHDMTLEDCVRDTHSLPPNTNVDQKFYIGFFRNNKLELIIDFYINFPEYNVIWIGLFMINGNLQRKGYGKYIINSFIQASKENGYLSIQLGVIEDNKEGLSFWKSFKFNEIRQKMMKEENNKKINYLVLEKRI
jgi:GNAT superfamily N-acetyltransferase